MLPPNPSLQRTRQKRAPLNSSIVCARHGTELKR